MLLVLPPYAPLVLGTQKNGRQAGSLFFTCQRMSDGLFLNGPAATWQTTPVLNGMKERGRTANNGTDPVTGALRGTYIPVDALNFANESDTLGEFIIFYHDKSKDNLVVDRANYQNLIKLRGTVSLHPAQALPARGPTPNATRLSDLSIPPVFPPGTIPGS